MKDSLYALNHNYKNGYRFFEIDFSKTSDNHIVCIHDWGDSAVRTFGKGLNGPPSLSAFNSMVASQSKYENCTLRTLSEWLNSHPDARIVTDVKSNNIEALKQICKHIKYCQERVIPQIYSPGEYDKAKEMGFEKIIWTLYRYKGDNDNVIRNVLMMDVYAVTMPISRVDSFLAARLKSYGIPSYMHTVNDPVFTDRLKDFYGVSNIYSDHLPAIH